MFNQIFRRQFWLWLICCLAIWAIASSIYAQALDDKGEGKQSENAITPSNASKAGGNQSDGGRTAWAISTIALLLAILAGFLGYMFILQKRFFDGCKEKEQMALFFQSPAGLPVGTVRSMLALLIVIISLYFIVLQAFRGLPFPDTLTAILGAVIGFYFGSRSAAKGQEEGLSEQVEQLQTERDEVVAERDGAIAERNQAVTERDEAATAREEAVTEKATNQTEAMLKKVQKGIALTKTATAILPENMRNKYGDVIDKLEQGANIVEALSQSGNVTEAVTKATEVFELFKTSNPVRDIVVKASQSFGQVLGGAVPPLAIIGTVIGVSTKLAGVAYQKWKARILHLPFSPAVIPLEVVDANTGFVLFLKSAIFKTAFTQELEENDRDFMKSAVENFLKQENTESLWTQYGKRFESREQFEEGLEEFRRAAADLELKKSIDAVPGLPAEVGAVGGYDPLLSSLDRIHTDANATADLDALVTVVEGLQRNGEPVQSIFNKIREEVSS
ncbi:hypothetical protein HYR99_15170 [Candidatus Poribacteria bacterium]|nr:hypothetical protein [Candidatus Poribacteria bacterium]